MLIEHTRIPGIFSNVSIEAEKGNKNYFLRNYWGIYRELTTRVSLLHCLAVFWQNTGCNNGCRK